MKKILFVIALLLLFNVVSATGSPTTEPKINIEEGTYKIKGDSDEKELRFKNVEPVVLVKDGDSAEEVNALINNTNKTLPTELRTLKGLPDNYSLVGGKFYEVDVVLKSTGQETHDGATFVAYLPCITNKTKEVGLIHYSHTKGFEYVKANSFNVSNQTAEFTLSDTSPIAFIVANGQSNVGGVVNTATTLPRIPILIGFGVLVAGIAIVLYTKKK